MRNTGPDASVYGGTFVDLLLARASQQPGAPAYTFLSDGDGGDVTLTYGDLERKARAVGAFLDKHVEPGARVLLCYPPGLDFIAGFFGCLCAGRIAVPAYPPRANRAMTALEAIAAQGQVSAVLTTHEIFAGRKGRASQTPALQELRWLVTDYLDPDDGQGWTPAEVDAETIAALQFTSGSTSLPRGVILTHRHLLVNARTIERSFEHTPTGRAVLWLPPYHDMGLSGGVLQPLYAGSHIQLMSPSAFLQRPSRWLRAISDHRAAYSGGPSFAYELCAEKVTREVRKELDLSCWTLAFNGAEPINPRVLDRFVEAFEPCGFRREAFYPCYGLAEATLFVSGGHRTNPPVVRSFAASALERHVVESREQTAEDSRTLVGCGHAPQGQRIVIVDPETHRRVETNGVGEIWVAGPNVAGGYWNLPDDSERVFRARLADTDADTDDGPFLRTGDLGFVHDDELFITGRLKELIIINGRNHYPQDLERTAATSHAALRAGGGAAFAIDLDGSERAVLIHEVERTRLRNLDESEVTHAIVDAVSAEHELGLHAVVLVPPATIPRTSSGKIRRGECRATFLADALNAVATWTARTGRTLAEAGADRDAVASGTEEARPGREGERERQHEREGERQREHGREREREWGSTTLSADEVQRWLIDRLSAVLDQPAAQLDPDRPFSHYGVGSVQAVGIAADLGSWLGRELPSTLAWDYPSIRALATHLAEPHRAVAGQHDAPAFGTVAAAAHAAATARVTDAEAAAIAVVGVGCRFPGAPDPDRFWDLLRTGADAIVDVPAGRWTEDGAPGSERGGERGSEPGDEREIALRQGGFLDRIDEFDPHFFGIAAREAPHVDPQQRLLLEVAWEALERSGIPADRLRGSRTGVFVGISTLDYMQLLMEEDAVHHSAHAATGVAGSIAANRLSYFFDLRGPSAAVDTACSSSLVAVHLACRSLRDGECNMAFAAGANLILTTTLTRSLAKAQMMSKSGRCRTFDVDADGYVRGEGIGVVLLKRLADARAAGDPILAVIRGSAMNQDGLSNGLTAPNGLAQQAVIREALAQARVAPSEVGFVETHGTGTPLGDPIEVDALKAVLSEGRSADRPCGLGAVKTNIGHLEAAAGIAGLIKTVLALRHGAIPPNLHLRQLNPRIALAGTPFYVPHEQARPWPRGTSRRVAGVSSFGFGGTNCHVILEEAPDDVADASDTAESTDREDSADTAEIAGGVVVEAAVLAPPRTERSHYLLTLSAQSEPALRALAARYTETFASRPELTAADSAFTANAGRSHFPYRRALVGRSTADFAEQLAARAPIEASGPDQATHLSRPRIAYLFTGQGSQYEGMGRQLAETQPVFREALERCAATFDALMDRPLLPLLSGDGPDAAAIHQTAYAQPALFALEYALYELWRSWGVRPHAVMGHSLGEYVAACVAGVLSPEDAMRLVATRARLMQSLPPGGEMAVALADEPRVSEALANQTDVVIASINGPSNTVITGHGDAMRPIVQRLAAQGIRCRPLQVSHAFHSALMEPMVAPFTEAASALSFAAPSIPLISNVTGRRVHGTDVPDAAYWARHLRQPVRFADGMRELHAIGCDLFLEIGPEPSLLAMGRRCLPDGEGTWLPSLRRGRDDWPQLLESLAQLYVRGETIDWAGFERPFTRSRVSLPTYPFQRQRYWVQPATATARSRRAVAEERTHGVAPAMTHPVLGERLPALAHLQRHHTWERRAVAVDVADSQTAHGAQPGRPMQPERPMQPVQPVRSERMAAGSNGTSLSSIAGYLDAALAAADEVLGHGERVVTDLRLLAAAATPAAPSTNGARSRQYTLRVDDDGSADLSVYARAADGSAGAVAAPDGWSLEATARIRSATTLLPETQVAMPPEVSAAVRPEAPVAVTSDVPAAVQPEARRLDATVMSPAAASPVAVSPAVSAPGASASAASAAATSLTTVLGAPAPGAENGHGERALDFSLMFFASSDDSDSGARYRLVIEAARYADAHGFTSVWVPERHFGQWGCLYPNPSVLHAALARETQRVRLRAGSVVLPLHHPFRVAEEWSVVDNLSGGRVDLSFASGWNPSDFALAPEKYATRHEDLFAGIEQVKRLWRGESLPARSGDGRDIALRIYPTPVQRDVGVWVTAAGNPHTFERAGAIGANVLTHLLDHGVEEVGTRIQAYRTARARAGHDPRTGRVTVMLHTFVGADVARVREQVREPFCAYLRTLAPSLKGLATSRGRTLQDLSPSDVDEFVAFLFERFFGTRALMGTPESCRGLVDQLSAAGVDEIACLLDFGPRADEVLDHLPHLNRLREQCADVEAGGTRAPATMPAVMAAPIAAGHEGVRELTDPKLPRDPLAAIRARCQRELSGDAATRLLGARLSAAARLWLGADEAFAEATTSSSTPETAATIEPAVETSLTASAALDAGLRLLAAIAAADREQTGIQGVHSDDAHVDGDHVTAAYRATGLQRYRDLSRASEPSRWMHVAITGRDGRSVTGNIRLLTGAGDLVAEAVGARLERTSAPARRESDLAEWLYEMHWEAAPVPAAQSHAGAWLLLADRSGAADALASALAAAGEACVRLDGDPNKAGMANTATANAAGANGGRESTGAAVAANANAEAAGTANPAPAAEAEAAALRSLLAAHAAEGRRLRGVIHLRSLDAESLETATLASLEAGQRWGTESALRAMQVLASSGGGTRLWLITRGVQAVGGERTAPAAAQAPLWGLGRTCAMEHPEIWGGVVDLDPDAGAADTVRHLVDVLRCGDREDQHALRGAERYVPRLVRRAAQSDPSAPVVVRADASYVITGGHQGVGLEVARWLTERGARHLVLLGRSVLPPRDEWDASNPATHAGRLIANLRSLEARGATVRYASVDIADEAAVRRWWAERPADDPPVRGVIHAASVWQSGDGQTLVKPLLQLEAAALRAVFAPKVTGSWLLHRVCASAPLEFFVCFSTAASLMGSAGQGNYAAASAFLDALAHHRRWHGSPALSINWGAIGEVGFGATAEGRRMHEYWETHGIQRLTPGHVRVALEHLLPLGAPQVAVMRHDWSRLARAFPLLRSLRWASGLVPRESSGPAEASAALLRMLAEAPAAKRRTLLIRYVRDDVARVMALDPSLVDVRRGLFEMGMDSLMALDLKNRLRTSTGVDVPATVVFEFPTIEAIAGYLEAPLVAAAGAAAADATANERAAPGGVPATAAPPAADASSTSAASATAATPAAAASDPSPSSPPDPRDELLARVRELSDQEVDRQLEQSLATRSAAR